MRNADSILIIDDESLVVETLKGNFQDNGYHVSTARSGEEGIRKFQNDRFDLVITDLKLKGMDGLQVSRKIKKINPQTPVIVVTGYSKLLSPDEANRFGVHDFVLKPFTWEQISKRVTECLGSPPQPSSNSSDSWIAVRKKNAPVSTPHLGRPELKSRKDPYLNLSQFLSGQTRILEMLIQGEPLQDILDALVPELESCSDGVEGSIHLLSADGKQLDCAAGPNLPAPLMREIAVIHMGGRKNPWETALTQNKPIIVEDIRQNPLWDGSSADSKMCGYRASWSFPIRDPNLQGAGILSFYSPEARSPSSVELRWMLSATRLLGILLEYKKLKSTLHQAERQIAALKEQSREGVLTFSDKGVIDSFNTTAAELLGYPGKSLLGQNIKRLVTGHASSHSLGPIPKTLNRGKEESGAVKVTATGLHRNGARFLLDLSVGELTQQTGRKFVATFTDATQLKNTETLLSDTRGKLEALGESAMARETSGSIGKPIPNADRFGNHQDQKEFVSLRKQLVQSEKWASTGKMAASLVHEFRNPLFGILNVLERAAREFSLKQGSEDLLELAVRECYRVMDLVEKMQDVHRPSSHSFELMDIHSVISDMVLLTQPRLDKKNIELVFDRDPQLPRIYGIEDQIKQVLLNLLHNAEEAVTEDRGKIIVKTQVLASTLKIRIQDNGKGIEEGQRKNIFEPFFTTKKDSGGMGLGLAVSFGIIKAHGGQIDVERGIGGKGASFIITLPKRTSRKATRPAEHYLTSPSLN